MNTIKGKNMVFSIYVDDNYYPVFCSKDIEFTVNQDEIETTSVNSGNYREFEPGMTNATLSASGVATLDNTNQRVSPLYLMQNTPRRTIWDCIITYTDDDGDDIVVDFSAFVVSINTTRQRSGYTQCSVNMRVTGGIGFDEIILPPVAPTTEVYSDYWATTNGLNYITGASAIHTYTLDSDTDEILEVSMEGIQYDVVSGTPTAGTRTCQFNASNDRIIFPSDVVFDGAQRVFVEFKRTT